MCLDFAGVAWLAAPLEAPSPDFFIRASSRSRHWCM
jgi:hypothetical protein